MKDRTYLLVVISIIIVIIILGVFSYRSSNPSKQEASKAPVAIQKTLNDSSASIRYTVKANYPEFSNVPLSVNAKIKSLVESQVSNFENQVSEADKTIPVTTGGELIITNQVSLANPNAISVWFKVMSSVPGMAHPNNYNLVYNYDLGEDKELLLQDLFQKDSNYVQTLSDLAKKNLLTQKELKSVEGLSYFVDQGAGPKAENFKLFNLTNDKLILIFNPGTVAPEFASTRSVEIPLSKLSSILNAPPVE